MRYVGSTSVKLLIQEDKNMEGDGMPMEKLDSFKKREPTFNRIS